MYHHFSFIFFSSALGWAPAQIGNFTACYGATQILSGKLASRTLPALGGRRFTTLSNLATVLAWALWGRARTMPAVAIALLVRFWTEIRDDFRRFLDEIWPF